jgi:multimeric flavodoxin WrbA
MVIFPNCTLKQSPDMDKHGVKTELIRPVHLDLASGTYPDMTEHGATHDDWLALLKKMMAAADILAIGTPIWPGDESSVCTRVIGRLYAVSGLLNEAWQHANYGRVGGFLVTGNEDGAKHCAMNVLY